MFYAYCVKTLFWVVCCEMLYKTSFLQFKIIINKDITKTSKQWA